MQIFYFTFYLIFIYTIKYNSQNKTLGIVISRITYFFSIFSSNDNTSYRYISYSVSFSREKAMGDRRVSKFPAEQLERVDAFRHVVRPRARDATIKAHRLHGRAQHGVARHDTARHGTAQHGAAWHCTARHGIVRHSRFSSGVLQAASCKPGCCAHTRRRLYYTLV